MRHILRHRPTPSMAIALVALFVVLSGTAVALPGKNRVDKNDYKRGSIGTRAIANNSIRSSDIRRGNVFSSDIANESILGEDVKNDTLTGDDVNESTLGRVPSAANADSAKTATTATSAPPSGPAGGDLAGTYPNPTLGANSVTTGKLANGQVRAPDLGPIITRTSSVAVLAGSSAFAAVTCPPEEVRLGGGAFFSAPILANKGVQASFASGSNTWSAVGRNNTAAEQTLNVQALCLQN